MRYRIPRFAFAVLALLVAFAAQPAMADDSLADISIGSGQVNWQPTSSNIGLIMTVSGPDGFTFREEFAPGEAPSLGLIDREGYTLPDGSYTWELRAHTVVDAGSTALTKSNTNRASLTTRNGMAKIPSQHGYFVIAGGAFASLGGEEASNATPAAGPSLATKDNVILDDLIVDGSACIGIDCVNGESFGFDTLRLKENNLRIKFQDTSASASFPSNDWQLTANDSSNGGANKFSIDDIDGGRTPFTIEAGAGANSLYVDDNGRIGNGTATPVVNIHTVEGNTPTLRLEQDGSSGFTPQTWDLAGNETNFFLRDVTNGSKLSFRVKPNAPENSIYVDTDGVGIGTSSPSSPLHVKRTDDQTYVTIENTSSAAVAGTNPLLFLSNAGASSASGGEHTLMRMEAAGIAAMYLKDNVANNEWKMTVQSGGVQITKTGTLQQEFLLTNAGDINIAGQLNAASDRNLKEAIVPVDSNSILQRVIDLPIATWEYKRDNNNARHLGPMAQDFKAAFGLGASDKVISVSDLASTSLAAVQALHTMVSEKETRIETLEAENNNLAERVAALEAMVQTLVETADK